MKEWQYENDRKPWYEIMKVLKRREENQTLDPNLVEERWKFLRVAGLAYALPATSCRGLDHDWVPDPFRHFHSMSGVRHTPLAVQLVWNVGHPTSLDVRGTLVQFQTWGNGGMGE